MEKENCSYCKERLSTTNKGQCSYCGFQVYELNKNLPNAWDIVRDSQGWKEGKREVKK